MVILKEGPAVPMGSLSARGCKLLDQKLQVLITCWLCKLDLFSRVQQLEAVKNGKKLLRFQSSFLGLPEHLLVKIFLNYAQEL